MNGTKVELSRLYTNQQIRTALEVVKQHNQPEFFAATLRAALANNWQPREEDEKKIEEAHDFLQEFKKEFDGYRFKRFICECSDDYVIFATTRKRKKKTKNNKTRVASEHLFRVSDKNFIASVKEFVKKII